MPLVDVFEVAHTKHRIGRAGFILLHVQDDIAPDHQAGNFFLCDIARVVNAHGPAAAHNRQPVGDLHDFVELVGDEDDGVALILEVNQLLEQFGRLLRGQNGGRLVENQNLRAAHEGFENLDLLLHADRNVDDLCLGLYMQVKPLSILLRDFNCLCVVDKKPLLRYHAEDHVLRDRQARNQHEVLMDHADAVGDGDRGGGEV